MATAPSAARKASGAMLLAGAAAVLFSSKSIFIKLAYAVPGIDGTAPVDAATLLTLRMLVALPFFIVIGLFAGRGAQRAPLTGRDHAALVGLGLIGYYFSSYLDFIGLRYISASLERLILYLYPTFTVLLSSLLYHKKIGRRTVLALALCYSGVALVFGHDLAGSGMSDAVWIGSGLVTISALTYAFYLVTGAEVIRRVGATRFTVYAMTVSCIACIAQFLVLNPLERLHLPAAVVGYGLLLGIVATVIPTFLTSFALTRIGANQVSLLGAVGPVATIALGAMILGETLNVWQGAGAALVIAGVLMITIRPNSTNV